MAKKKSESSIVVAPKVKDKNNKNVHPKSVTDEHGMKKLLEPQIKK